MSRGEYPATRMRRNRMKAFSRRLVAENSISTDDLIELCRMVDKQQVMPEFNVDQVTNIASIINQFVRRDMIPLFMVLEDKAAPSEGQGSDNRAILLRFVHLTFQEVCKCRPKIDGKLL